MRALHAWAGTLLVAGWFSAPAGWAMTCTLPAGDHALSLNHGGLRTFSLHVPPGCDPERPWPLVVDFHGFTLNGADQAARSGFRALADTEGFVVAHADGLGGAWNGIVCCGGSNADDVNFARALVDDVEQRLPIDPLRIYATGFSNGGLFSHRLVCHAPEVFAAAAPVAFQLPHPTSLTCNPARPVAVIHFHGLFDGVVPYNGSPLLQVPSAPESLDRWAAIDGCIGRPVRTPLGPGSYCDRYETCDGGVKTELCSLAALHSAYTNADNVPVAERAWAFLSGYTLVPEPSAGSLVVAGLGTLAGLAWRRRRAARIAFREDLSCRAPKPRP